MRSTTLINCTGNPDQAAEAGDPTVVKFDTAHAHNILFPESAVVKLLPI